MPKKTFKNSAEYHKLMSALAEVKQINLNDLKQFLTEDHNSFSVLTAVLNQISSTQKTSVTISKNSAKSFYLGKTKAKAIAEKLNPAPKISNNCYQDAQNCQFFKYFNSAERKHYFRFLNKVEANFEGSQAGPLLFLTLTFNTTHDNIFAFTTNWDQSDQCWNLLTTKYNWIKDWAAKFDTEAEPLKVKIKKVLDNVANYVMANNYLTKFLRDIRLKWKPNNWKWVVVPELQKNGNWHFHLLSTPIVPYAHNCVS